MNGWTPLFQQIIGSSIWSTPDHVRIAWITLLACAGKDGVAPVTAGGLATLGRMTRENAEDALRVLSSPDDDTLTQEYEGRRIERVANGWKLLNWEKYREQAKKAILGEQNRLAQQRFRDKAASVEAAKDPEGSRGNCNRPASVEIVIETGKMIGVIESECRRFWDHYESTSRPGPNGETVWVTGQNGEKVVGKWASLLKMWGSSARGRETPPPAPAAAPKPAGATRARGQPSPGIIDAKDLPDASTYGPDWA